MLKRDESTDESRRFWRSVDEAAAEVEAWPDWTKLFKPPERYVYYIDIDESLFWEDDGGT